MKYPNLKLLFLLIFALCSFAFSQNTKGVGTPTVSNLPAKAKRFALIIGVDTYQKDISPLYGTVNDARALRDVLIKYAGFSDENIILMTTDSNDSDLIPTRGNIIDQLDKLQRVVPENGLILFSFSGHGVSIGDDAFIVPSDGRIYQNADLMRERAIDVLRIKRAVQATKVKQVIMFLDACRNDPVKSKGDVDNNLTTAYAKGFSFETKNQNIEAYATLYATSFGDRAYEFLDKKTNKWRGYFSYAIEEGLKGSAANDKGEVTLAGLIIYIEDSVKERVRINLNEKQIPYPTTEGFRNSDLVIAVVERNTPITTNTNSSVTAVWNNLRSIANLMLQYDFVESPSEGLAKVQLNNRYGFIDRTGVQVIPVKYDYVDSFSEGLARVKLNGKWGFIDEVGREIIPFKYDSAWDFSEGLASIKVDGKWGFIDKAGREIISPKYDYVHSFSEGLSGVSLSKRSGFIDKNGKEIIPIKYDIVDFFFEGLARVKLNGKYGFIDKVGREIIPFKYDYSSASTSLSGIDFRDSDGFSEGLARVELKGKYGFIDKVGREIIPFKYDFVWNFSEGLAEVYLNGKWGFIDKNGREIIPLKYDSSYLFENGLAKVKLNNRTGFIDKSGKEVIPRKYDSVWCYALEDKGFIGVKIIDKKGFVDIYSNEYFDF